MARTCGNVGCSERDKTQEQCNAGKCERIGCASVKEKTGEEPGDRQRRCNPDDNPDKRRASPFAYDQEQNIAALCTDCHANPDFLCTTRDKICDRAVEAHCHKHETGDGNDATRRRRKRRSASQPAHLHCECREVNRDIRSKVVENLARGGNSASFGSRLPGGLVTVNAKARVVRGGGRLRQITPAC